MDIKPVLNLNKHPRDCEDRSIIYAKNVMLNLDKSVIQTEPSILVADKINNRLRNELEKYKIIGCIECNKELVLFCIKDISTTSIEIKYDEKIYIVRYNEENDNVEFKGYIENNKVSNGDDIYVKGTFTYNVDGHLIIIFCECYNRRLNNKDTYFPMKTINLDEIKINNSSKSLENKILPLQPEIKVPNIISVNYVKGNIYKGIYNFFIRFKINNNDYTKWFSIGNPIIVDTLEENNIIKHCFNQTIFDYAKGINDDEKFLNSNFRNSGNLGENDQLKMFPSYSPIGFVTGCTDYISSTTDIAQETINVKIKLYKKNNGHYINSNDGTLIYQIGFSCSTKAYTKCFSTYDLLTENDIIDYTINQNSVREIELGSLVKDYINYYNVNNIINYKNKVYIANYNETIKDLDYTKLENFASSCELKLNVTKDDSIYEVKYKTSLIYKGEGVKISETTEKEKDGTTTTIEVITPSDYINNNKQSMQFDCNENTHIELSSFLNVDGETEIQIEVNNATHNVKAKDAIIKPVIKLEIWKSFATIVLEVKGTKLAQELTTITVNGNKKIINPKEYYIIYRQPYYNVNDDFNKRKSQHYLLPGEVYSIYVHFIDKYGNITEGFKLKNKLKENKYYEINYINDNTILNKNIDINNDFVRKNGELNIDDDTKKFFIGFDKEEYDNVHWYQIADKIIDIIGPCDFGYFENSIGDKLFKVPYGVDNKYCFKCELRSCGKIPDEFEGICFSYEPVERKNIITGFFTNCDFRSKRYKVNSFSNSNKIGDKFDTASSVSDNILPPLNMYDTKTAKFYSSALDITDKLKFSFSVMRCKKVNISEDKTNYKYWQTTSNFDKPVDLNRVIEPSNELNDLKYYNITNYRFCAANSVEDNRQGLGTCIEIDNDYNLFSKVDVEYKGDDTKADSNKLATALPYSINYKDPDTFEFKVTQENLPNFYIATLIDISNNIYTSNTKKLIRCTDYIYKNDIIDKSNIEFYFDGKLTKDGVLVYEGHGIMFDSTKMEVISINNGLPYYPIAPTFPYIDRGSTENEITGIVKALYNDESYKHNSHAFVSSYDAYTPFVGYVQFPVWDNYMHESKSFNNKPKGQVYPIYTGGSPLFKNGLGTRSMSSKAVGCMVTPQDSIDLFENRQLIHYDIIDNFYIKTLINYDKDNIPIQRYDKTIRRSNVISDESKENNWRKFDLDAYRVISENKGNITNIYGTGTIFLVHTEHSIFIFNIDNTMKTEGKDIQLLQSDTFDVDYKELATSNLGYAGLQDFDSWTADQFGYMYYNKDARRFFIFDNMQLGNPDEEIIEFLKIFKAEKCIFANDNRNRRLLCNLINESIRENIILSFDYDLKKFISTHEYNFDDAYHTKNNLYLKYNVDGKDTLYYIDNNDSSFSIFKNSDLQQRDAKYVPAQIRQDQKIVNVVEPQQVFVDTQKDPYFREAKLSIVLNSQYELTKFIEHLTYKLYKIAKLNNRNIHEYISSPVSEKITPFSGVSLRVYNELVDTGVLDILIEAEDAKNIFCNYKKPYWELGQWNFSYLFDSKRIKEQSRLYGNWFVVEIILNNDDNKVEFENIIVNLSKDKQV